MSEHREKLVSLPGCRAKLCLSVDALCYVINELEESAHAAIGGDIGHVASRYVAQTRRKRHRGREFHGMPRQHIIDFRADP